MTIIVKNVKESKIVVFTVLTAALLMASLNSCIPVKAQGTATVDTFSSIGGTTSPAAGTYTNYTVGTTYTFTETPASGNSFLYWIVATAAGGATYTTPTLSYNITESTTLIQAMFIPTTNTTVSSSQTGAATVELLVSIGGSTVPAAGTYTNYTAGTVSAFKAVPGTGFSFLCWVVASSSANIYTANPLAYNVSGTACGIQAMFIPTSSTVTLPTPTVNEFSSAIAVILAAVLATVAVGTYTVTRKNKK